MIKINKIFLWVAMLGALIVFSINPSIARENPNEKQAKIAKTTGITSRTLSNIGNWGYWFLKDGLSASDPFTGASGGFYPRGTAGAIYLDGLVWGGLVNDSDPNNTKLRVGGNTYRNGTQSGSWGVSPDDESSRIYRIRGDWKTLTKAVVLTDAAELNNVATDAVTDQMAQDVIDQYLTDWETWPTKFGAPYVDVNENGEYDPVLDDDDMPIVPGFDDNGDPIGGDYPGIAQADQVIFFVINDDNEGRVTNLYGSIPIGLEVQTTVWAYNQPENGLGQIVFKKYKVTNKSVFQIDSMYFSQWCDPDLGDYGNDLTGCDVDLSMMFAYNGVPADAQYAAFKLAPPAVGYDFFQGPMVASPGDTAVFDLKKVADHKNLPMTSYGYFGSGTDWGDPDLGEYDGTLQWFNLLRGYAPTNDVDKPTWFTHDAGPNAGDSTKFPLDGDPVTREGDIDGVKYQPGDRRMLQCTGPFTMIAGAVQEVVVAVVGGLGANNISSIADMKSTDLVAQKAYNSLFTVVPKPPSPPNIKASVLEDKISINWGWDGAAVEKTEETIIIDYEFEGYNIYQLTSALSKISDKSTVKVATFDIVNDIRIIYSTKFVPEYGTVVEVPIQYGSDSGIKRTFTVEKNYLNGDPLYRGTPYYFAVTAYNYDGNLVRDRALESAPVIYQVVPQDPNPGVRIDSDVDDEVEVSHDVGTSDGNVVVKVVDPYEVTGHEYKVTFEEDVDTNSATYGEIMYNVIDVTDDNKLLINMGAQVTIMTDETQLIIDGLQVIVAGPNPGIKQISEHAQDGTLLDGSVSYLPPSLGTTGYLLENRDGHANGALYDRTFDRFGYWTTDDVEIDFSESSISWDYSSEAVQFETLTGDAFYAPYAVYRHTVAGETYRLFAGFWDTDGDGTWNNNGVDWVGTNYGAPSYEPIYAWQGYDAAGNPINYDPANDAQYITDNSLETSANTTWGGGTGEFHYPYMTATLFTMYLADATPPWGNDVMFFTNKPNTTTDEFIFTAPGSSESTDLAKQDVGKVNVFPNPYYAGNVLETNRFGRFVTFNHLPQKATFRIFNLAGSQVKKLDKDNSTQFFTWNLQNETGLPVASGVYIVHVDMPDLGQVKVLKLFIVQSQQVLEFY